MKNIIAQTIIDKAIIHGEYIQEGNHKKANKLNKELSTMIKEFIEVNDWFILKELLDYPNESVKIWIATVLLKYNEDMAISALKELSNSETIFSLNAKALIDMHNKGII